MSDETEADIERLRTRRTQIADDLRALADGVEQGNFDSVFCVAVASEACEAEGGLTLSDLIDPSLLYPTIGYVRANLQTLIEELHNV